MSLILIMMDFHRVGHHKADFGVRSQQAITTLLGRPIQEGAYSRECSPKAPTRRGLCCQTGLPYQRAGNPRA